MKQKNNIPSRKEDVPPLDESLPKELKKIIEFIPEPEQKQKATEILLSEITITSAYSRPLPRAEQMELYEKILSGSANRIITMAEKQNIHRIEMEKLSLPLKSRQHIRGQWFCFIIGMSGIGVTSLLALSGHDWVAGVIGTVSIGTILTALYRYLKENI